MSTSDNATPFKATEYDANVIKVIPYYGLFHDEIIDLVQTLQPSPSLWLDTGCGTGRLVAQAAEVFPETRFVAADPAEGMLNEARQRLSAFGKRIQFIPCGTGPELNSHLDTPPQVISAVLCHHYCQAAERLALARSIYEQLAPGGLYVTFEIIRPRTKRSEDLALERWGRHQLAQGRDPEAVENHLARHNRSVFPITIDEHLHNLEKAGFQTVDLFWTSRMQAGFYAIKGASC